VLEFVDLMLPFMTMMVNKSLVQGRFPTSQKHAIITPRLKKAGLDPADITNFRPISNLTYFAANGKR